MTREEAIGYLSAELKKTEEVADLTERDFGVTESVWHTEVNAFKLAIAALRGQDNRIESDTVKNGWISVEERLPECDQRVLCRYTFGDDGRMYFHQVLDYYATDPQPHFQHTLGDSKMRVIHWMPLPEPPKEEV